MKKFLDSYFWIIVEFICISSIPSRMIQWDNILLDLKNLLYIALFLVHRFHLYIILMNSFHLHRMNLFLVRSTGFQVHLIIFQLRYMGTYTFRIYRIIYLCDFRININKSFDYKPRTWRLRTRFAVNVEKWLINWFLAYKTILA